MKIKDSQVAEILFCKIRTSVEENDQKKPSPFFYKLLMQVLILAIPLILLIKLPTLLPLYKVTGVILLSVILLFSIIAFSVKHKTLFNLLRTISIYCLIAVAAVFLAYMISRIIVITDAKGLETLLREHMSLAKLIYFSICFAQPIILPLPEMVTVIAGSAVLGPLTAFLLGFSGTFMGVLTMFVISRTGGMKVVKRLVNKKQLERYHRWVHKNEVLILTILFIIPILPDEIICVGAGISGVKGRRFICIAFLAKAATSFSLAYSLNWTEILFF